MGFQLKHGGARFRGTGTYAYEYCMRVKCENGELLSAAGGE